jgi:hypothetical protein
MIIRSSITRTVADRQSGWEGSPGCQSVDRTEFVGGPTITGRVATPKRFDARRFTCGARSVTPSSGLLVAGELLAAKPIDARWAIKGELVELLR